MTVAVGLTAWRGEFPTYAGPQVLDTLETTYTSAVIDAGMLPLVIPNGLDTSLAPRMVEILDGLILTGGGDIDPATYGRLPQRVEKSDIAVDRFEIALVAAAREARKPVLAICRGLQLLNVALGGTLTQDVTAPGSAHEPIAEGYDPDEAEERRHPVTLDPAGVLASVFEATDIKVNTLHHQGVDQLAPGLIVEGVAPDGLIEAARCDGSWWAIGVQWHPERLEGEMQQQLFGAFKKELERPSR